MCPGNSLIGSNEPEEGSDAWDQSVDKGGGRGIQFSGVPDGFLAQKYQCWQNSSRAELLATDLCSEGKKAQQLPYRVTPAALSGLDPRSLASSLLPSLSTAL